jgi:hypothetical protein
VQQVLRVIQPLLGSQGRRHGELAPQPLADQIYPPPFRGRPDQPVNDVRRNPVMDGHSKCPPDEPPPGRAPHFEPGVAG